MLSIRVFFAGWGFLSLAIGVALAFDDTASATAIAVPAVCTALALFVVARGLLAYGRATVTHVKAREADDWISAVHEFRIEHLTEREAYLTNSIAGLNERFEQEKAALQEVRDERMAEERMLGFLDGLKKYPQMYAHHANPKNRLRVVRDEEEESA
ncbi:hypothetical protein GTY88_48295 [Streptomyces sp. SID5926]|nr:hypothetical protein [Streptomyces sp. SID5926]